MHNEHSHVCPWWMAYTFDTPIRSFQTPVAKVLKPYLKEGMTFVDFGCGMGFFSLSGAKIVGEKGKVISVDIQQKMLDIVKTKTEKAKLCDIIQTHLTQPGNINLEAEADFALAMWMVHETSDFCEFFKQTKATLKPGSSFLIVEPSFHVSAKVLESEKQASVDAGFEFVANIGIGLFSKGFLLRA